MKVTRCFYWKRGLDAHMMMPTDDTGVDVWIVGVRKGVIIKGSVLDIGYSPLSFLRRYKRWFR